LALTTHCRVVCYASFKNYNCRSLNHPRQQIISKRLGFCHEQSNTNTHGIGPWLGIERFGK
jgi:hypothetical protein